MKRPVKKSLWLALGLCAALLIALALLCLSPSDGYPERAADGSAWDRSWAMLGPVLGAEEPGGGLTLKENNSVLTGDDIYYASWTAGESSPFVNEDGDEVEVYDAQLYLLVCGCADGDYARQNVDSWLARERETYAVTQESTLTANGQEYTLLLYDCVAETNPYDRGAAAFTVYGSYAVTAELPCREGWEGDAETVLLGFLERCHYSAQAG